MPISYILQRLLRGLIVLFCLITITFFLVRAMPGGPFSEEREISKHIKEEMERYYGFDKPIWAQYLLYLKNVFIDFDLGPSYKKEGYQVSTIISQSFWVSVRLGTLAMLFAVLIGVPFGAYAAFRKNQWQDHASMAFAMVGICIPSFVVGPLLAIFFGLKLGWFPVSGLEAPTDLILPAITLGLISAAYLARLTRSGMLDILSQDFIRTAKAKGLPDRTVIFRHALRGGVLPAVAFLGPAFAESISGSFVVEVIFNIPGMGQHFINGTINRDYTLIQGLVLFFGILIVVANLAADLITAYLDPRIKLPTKS